MLGVCLGDLALGPTAGTLSKLVFRQLRPCERMVIPPSVWKDVEVSMLSTTYVPQRLMVGREVDSLSFLLLVPCAFVVGREVDSLCFLLLLLCVFVVGRQVDSLCFLLSQFCVPGVLICSLQKTLLWPTLNVRSHAESSLAFESALWQAQRL
jgi:hypothetical protein